MSEMKNSSTELVFVVLDVLIWNNFRLNASTVCTAEAGLLESGLREKVRRDLPTKGTVQIIPSRGKDRKYSGSLSWLNQEHFPYFRHEKEDCTKGKLGQLTTANCTRTNQRSCSWERDSGWAGWGTLEGPFLLHFRIKVSCNKVA